MNIFEDNESYLKEDQFNLSLSGPSKLPLHKPKSKKFLWDLNNIELGDSLVNIKPRSAVKSVKGEKDGKTKKHKEKPIVNTRVQQLLLSRLNMYNNAEKKARLSGDIKKARLLNREILVLNALIAHHNSGNIIDPDNIPPEIKTNNPKSKTTKTQLGVTFNETAEIKLIPRIDWDSASSLETKTNIEKVLGILKLRRDQYKIASVQNRSAGNIARSFEYLNIVKMFESVVKHLENGEQIELNELPGTPEYPISNLCSQEHLREEGNQNKIDNISESLIDQQTSLQIRNLKDLQARLKVYQNSISHAKKRNNVEEELRINRIIKVYKHAIKLYKKGISFPIGKLPIPAGYVPTINLETNSLFKKLHSKSTTMPLI